MNTQPGGLSEWSKVRLSKCGAMEQKLNKHANLLAYFMARRSTEVAVTGLTRNQFIGQPIRGFESHLLRHILSENPE